MILSIRFGLSRRQVIYLIAGAILLTSSCTLALAEKPTNWDKVLEKGNQQLTLGNTKVAEEIFAGKLQKYPNSGVCHLAYGKALKRNGKLDQAKTEFRAATENEPTLAEAQYELGVMMESDKQYQGAAEAFQKYIDLKPDAGNRQLIQDRIRFCQGNM